MNLLRNILTLIHWMGFDFPLHCYHFGIANKIRGIVHEEAKL
jgi:hypothetical protein